MNLAIVFVIAAAVALVVILGAAVTRSLQTVRKTAAAIQPVDMEAFRNLIDVAEDEYLRRRLPSAEFRMVQRERLLAMAAYVRAAKNNAAVLVREGQAALANGDPRLATAAHELVDDALRLQRNATVALMRIYVAWTWPSSKIAPGRVADRYERLNAAAMLLGRLQNPAVPVRLSARF